MIRAGRGACADCADCLRPFRCTTQGLAAATFQAIFAQGLAIFWAGPDDDYKGRRMYNTHVTFGVGL
ncbi:hypothetical protein DERF_010402 [Dermatophagoides farinae]|uniref:Uncharacterized protein n=1 Tax=Dermatophagoides farinae TaxID=6954 RepID=A0A922HZ84_DERFA|nr:hypothetical protein DERF_010402 [Dermatophagoides farinae]